MVLDTLLAVALLQVVQEPAALGPTPSPDCYDDAYDASLFKVWEGAEIAIGRRDAHLAPQPAPLRPRDWLVLEGASEDPGSRAHFLREHLVCPLTRLPIEERGRAQVMPCDGPLQGTFAYAFARFKVEASEVCFLRAPGAEIVFINGEGFIGDPDRRGWLGVPVALENGANEILAVGIRGGFELDLWKPVTRLVMASWAVEVNQLFGGPSEHWPDPLDELSVPLFNASLDPAESICFHYDRAYSGASPPRLGEWSCGGHAAPLGLARGYAFLFDPQKVPVGRDLLAPAAAFLVDGTHGDRRLLPLRTDHPRPSWPAPVARSWPVSVPPRIPGHQPWPIFIYERTGDTDLDRTILAVARFSQQRLWERSGTLAALISPEAYDARREGPQSVGFLVRFGGLEGGPEGMLYTGPETQVAGDAFAIRAADPAGMRLVYEVEPFFPLHRARGRVLVPTLNYPAQVSP